MPNRKDPNQPPQMIRTKPVRVSHSISFPYDQDEWLTGLLGEGGNLSGFIQALVEAARSGKIDTDELLRNQRDSDAITRAVSYMKAKEAGMLFEEDVANVLGASLNKHRKLVRGRVHNEQGPLFIADFSIEDEKGRVLCSVNCKSSPRADRLQLALAEAMIGQQKTGKPVIVVVPYLLDGDPENAVAAQYRSLKYTLAELGGLPDAVNEALAAGP